MFVDHHRQDEWDIKAFFSIPAYASCWFSLFIVLKSDVHMFTRNSAQFGLWVPDDGVWVRDGTAWAHAFFHISGYERLLLIPQVWVLRRSYPGVWMWGFSAASEVWAQAFFLHLHFSIEGYFCQALGPHAEVCVSLTAVIIIIVTTC